MWSTPPQQHPAFGNANSSDTTFKDDLSVLSGYESAGILQPFSNYTNIPSWSQEATPSLNPRNSAASSIRSTRTFESIKTIHGIIPDGIDIMVSNSQGFKIDKDGRICEVLGQSAYQNLTPFARDRSSITAVVDAPLNSRQEHQAQRRTYGLPNFMYRRPNPPDTAEVARDHLIQPPAIMQNLRSSSAPSLIPESSGDGNAVEDTNEVARNRSFKEGEKDEISVSSLRHRNGSSPAIAQIPSTSSDRQSFGLSSSPLRRRPAIRVDTTQSPTGHRSEESSATTRSGISSTSTPSNIPSAGVDNVPISPSEAFIGTNGSGRFPVQTRNNARRSNGTTGNPHRYSGDSQVSALVNHVRRDSRESVYSVVSPELPLEYTIEHARGPGDSSIPHGPPVQDIEKDIRQHYQGILSDVDRVHQNALEEKDKQINIAKEEVANLARQLEHLQSEIARNNMLAYPAENAAAPKGQMAFRKAQTLPPLNPSQVRTFKMALKRRADKISQAIDDNLASSGPKEKQIPRAAENSGWKALRRTSGQILPKTSSSRPSSPEITRSTFDNDLPSMSTTNSQEDEKISASIMSVPAINSLHLTQEDEINTLRKRNQRLRDNVTFWTKQAEDLTRSKNDNEAFWSTQLERATTSKATALASLAASHETALNHARFEVEESWETRWQDLERQMNERMRVVKITAQESVERAVQEAVTQALQERDTYWEELWVKKNKELIERVNAREEEIARLKEQWITPWIEHVDDSNRSI